MHAHTLKTVLILMTGGMIFAFSSPMIASRDQKDDESGGWFKPGCFLGKPNGIFEEADTTADAQLMKEIQVHNAQLNQAVDINAFQATFERLGERILAAQLKGLTVNVEELNKHYSLKGIGMRAIEKIESTLGYLPAYTLVTSTPLEPGACGKGRLIPLTATEILRENAHIVIPFFQEIVEKAEVELASFKTTDQTSGIIYTFYVASLLKLIKEHML